MDPRIHRAIYLAERVHKNQKYHDHPYMYHLLRVLHRTVAAGGTTTQRIVSVLHDTVEDGSEHRNIALREIEVMFGPTVVNAVDAITRRSAESYTEYLARCVRDPNARFVKEQDLCENIEQTYAGQDLTQEMTNETQRRLAKYLLAYQFVTGREYASDTRTHFEQSYGISA